MGGHLVKIVALLAVALALSGCGRIGSLFGGEPNAAQEAQLPEVEERQTGATRLEKMWLVLATAPGGRAA